MQDTAIPGRAVLINLRYPHSEMFDYLENHTFNILHTETEWSSGYRFEITAKGMRGVSFPMNRIKQVKMYAVDFSGLELSDKEHHVHMFLDEMLDIMAVWTDTQSMFDTRRVTANYKGSELRRLRHNKTGKWGLSYA